MQFLFSDFVGFDHSETCTPPLYILGSEKFNFILKTFTVRKSKKDKDIKKTDCGKQSVDLTSFSLVAGTGLEPVTFGL